MNKILRLMIGLTLQETYWDDPDQLKKDFERLSQKGENLGKDIRVAIEETTARKRHLEDLLQTKKEMENRLAAIDRYFDMVAKQAR